jgi:signal transduction histidine kinase
VLREQVEPSAGEAGAEPSEAVLAAVREHGFRVFRLVGTGMSLLALGALALRRGTDHVSSAPGLPLVLVLALGVGVLTWFVPVRWHGRAGAILVGIVSLLTAVALWTVGPTLPVGSLLVMVPVAATAFFGPRAAAPALAAVALALLLVGVATAALGRPAVGLLAGAAIPLAVYARLAVITLGAAVVTVAAERAALLAMGAAVRRAQQAAGRVGEEQERRRQAERALAHAKRLEAIGELAAGVVHDTRNALTVLSAGLEELRARPLSPEDAVLLSDLSHAASSVSGTMGQLLALGRREASTVQAVPLASAVASLAGSLRRVLPPEIAVRLEGTGEARVLLDPVRLEQAVLNLALNARDAMPAGGTLTLRVQGAPGGAGPVVLEVEDTGTGMDAATAARAFEPFYTTKPEGTGTGLGLAMVRRFVDDAGGAVEVATAAGRGTRLRLSFPAAPEPGRHGRSR